MKKTYIVLLLSVLALFSLSCARDYSLIGTWKKTGGGTGSLIKGEKCSDLLVTFTKDSKFRIKSGKDSVTFTYTGKRHIRVYNPEIEYNIMAFDVVFVNGDRMILQAYDSKACKRDMYTFSRVTD